MTLTSPKVKLLFTIVLALAVFIYGVAANAGEEKLSVTTLPNGMKVLIQEDHARKVATIQIWVMVGSADEVNRELGISHVIEHMAFKGTEKRGVGKIASEIEALGGETNAYTSWDETVFHVTVPSDKVAQGIDILTDAVFRPTIDSGELDKEKQVVIEEILEGEERPERKAGKLLFDTAYTKHPYKIPIIGYKDTVGAFTRDDIMKFRSKWYVPENMFMVVVGDVNKDDVLRDIEKFTADLKPAIFTRPERPVEPAQKDVRISILPDRNSRETRLHMAFHIPEMKSADVNALDLAGDILGARDNSRLVRVLKKEKGLVNSISAYAMTPKDPGLMVVSATLDSKNIDLVVTGIMEEIRRLANEPPTKEELEEAKTHIESQHIYSRETVSGIARELGNYQADVGDPHYAVKYLKINSAITPEEVSKIFKEYVRVPNVTLSVLVPEAGADNVNADKLKQIIASFSTSKTQVAAETESDSKKIEKTLPNGLRVVLSPDDSNPVISIRLGFLGGKRFETKETEGVMNFVSQMLDKGTKNLNEVQIAKTVDDMGGRLAGFSGYDSFGFSISFFSRFLDDGLKLLAELYNNTSFPQEQLDRERALIINKIRTEPDRPVVFAINQLNALVFEHHPYGFNKEGTLTTVTGFNADDLKQTYQRYSVPSNAVLTIVGDFNAEKALEKINQYFGTVPAKKLDAPDIPKEEKIASQRIKEIKIPRAKAHLAIGYQSTTLKDEDRYPLEVLNNILAGQGGSLFQELRDKQSLAYTVTSFVRPGIDPGIFAFYIACDESKAARALTGLFSEIEKIRKAPPAKEELERSINNLIGNHLINLQSSWSRAENIVLNTLYGLGPDYDQVYVKRVRQVTGDDVLRVAQKYLDPAHSAVIKIVPDDQPTKQ